MTSPKLKTDIIVEARMNSSRLPGKVMKNIQGFYALEILLSRLSLAKNIDDIIIATTNNCEDDIIVSLATKKNIKYFRGDEEDVLNRVTKAAENFNTDIIIEITADDLFVEPSHITQVAQYYQANYGLIDVCCNDYILQVPLGFYVRAFSKSILIKIEQNNFERHYRENVEAYFYNNDEKFKFKNIIDDPKLCRQDLRLTLDTDEDLNLISIITKELFLKNSNFTLREFIDFMDKNPELKKINSGVKQKKLII